MKKDKMEEQEAIRLIAGSLDRLGQAVDSLRDAIHEQTTQLQNTITTGTDKTVECMQDLKLETVKGQGSIRSRIYIALVGMVTIILSLVALWMK